ncbi:mycothiol conjugate amidase Mca [Tersicoccus sp. Bi-70]|uniref:mycothiol conjugate amidase Mca n=1 Tax=Tersicoccus sp. Bi-70 TaxID=1897634 RepID=UPI000978C8AD|nr:mycothiol conjugate amidase Mca [Tersicoccus sp. Bi-70]OMH31421.1 mycothiol conjugate amidase Mca [Tersicoccus sp. Bi-70]
MPESVPPGSLRLLTVHAHPDDESSKGAATMAKYVHAGAGVMVATCTGGEQGSILNSALASEPRAHRDLPGLRRVEMANAAAALGIEQQWLGFADSGLPEGDPPPDLHEHSFAMMPLERAAAPLVRLVRRFRPHVIVSYDENGGYPHPDHIMAHRVAVEAYHAAGDPDRYPGTGEAWAPSKLYYDRAFNPARFTTLHEAMEERGIESPFAEWIAKRMQTDAEGNPPPGLTHETTTRIECADWFEARDAALKSHRSQVAPDGFFFAAGLDLQREVWPWEEYTLIDARVPTELPETDLFAGIEPESAA